MQERTALDEQLGALARIEQELDDQATLIELGEAENDQQVIAEAEAGLGPGEAPAFAQPKEPEPVTTKAGFRRA